MLLYLPCLHRRTTPFAAAASSASKPYRYVTHATIRTPWNSTKTGNYYTICFSPLNLCIRPANNLYPTITTRGACKAHDAGGIKPPNYRRVRQLERMQPTTCTCNSARDVQSYYCTSKFQAHLTPPETKPTSTEGNPPPRTEKKLRETTPRHKTALEVESAATTVVVGLKAPPYPPPPPPCPAPPATPLLSPGENGCRPGAADPMPSPGVGNCCCRCCGGGWYPCGAAAGGGGAP